MSDRRDIIADYFRRQYETKEGAVQENVEGLFSEDLVFHLTGEKTMGRDALVTLCDLLRRIRHDQATMVTQFDESNEVRKFPRVYIVGKDPRTGLEVSVSTRTEYRFENDEVVEVWQENPAALEQAVRAAGVRL